MTFALFSLWTFVLIGRPQELVPALAVLRPALLLTMLTVPLVFLGTPQTLLENLRRTPEAKRSLIFFAIMIMGIPFAYHRRVAFDFTFTYYVANILFLLVFVSLVDSVAKFVKILWVVTICAWFYAVFGLLRGVSTGGRFFIQGSMFDPNDIAYVLVTLLPLSFFFILRSDGGLKRILVLIGAGASLVLILLTGSRAGLLGLGAVLLLLVLTRAGSIKIGYKVALVAGIALVAVLNFEKINVERYLTLTDLEADYNLTSGTGRVEVWKMGMELLLKNPLTGVGARCFPMAIGYLRAEAGLPPVWQAVHNSYLQIAAETGVIGIAVFISLILGSLRTFSKARKQEASSVDGRRLNAIAGSLQLGFIGSLICAFFLSQAYSIFFTLFFASSAVVRKLSAEVAAAENAGEVFHAQRPGWRKSVKGREERALALPRFAASRRKID